jgi:DNA-binding transcriptional LysR family regulator
VYEQLERVVTDTREAANGIAGTLSVGSYIALNLGPHWVRIVTDFERRHPGCHVEFVDTGARDYLDPLRSGELDLVAARLPLEQPDIEIGPILSHEKRVLIIAKGDPLAMRAAVSVEDFADRPVVGRAAGLPSETFDAFIPPVSPSGRRLTRVPPRSMEEVRLRVARGELVHATVESAVGHLKRPDTTAVPISDLPPSETALVWLAANESPKIEAFVRTAAEVLSRTELAPYQQATGWAPSW